MAKKIPTETTIHGRTRVDEYAWLRNKGAPDVVSHLQEENAFTAKMTAGTEGLRTKLYDELLARVKQDDSTPPYSEGDYLYYRRFEAGKQYPIRARKKKGTDKELVLLDLNEIAKTEKFVDVRTFEVSDDGNVGAYLLDTAGFRQYTLKTKDLRSGKTGSESIPRVDDVRFAKDGTTLFYVTEDEQTKRSDKLWRHTLGQDAAKDTLVYQEKDEMFDLRLDRTLDGAFLVATSASKTASEVRVIDAGKPTSAPVLIAPREKDHEYYVDHRQGTFYIRTNSGGRNFRLVTAPVNAPQRASWKEVIPHRPDVMLEDVGLFQDFWVAYERKDALPLLSIHEFATNTTSVVEQPEQVYDVVPTDNHEFAAKTIRFRYQSLKTPVTWIDHDVKTKKRTVVKRTEVPTYDESKYETKRVTIPARDGTPVLVSLVFAKGTTPDGTHPLYLYAYGSYGLTLPLSFSSDRISLIDRGFVYAFAHIRGGGDMGKKWHDQGRMMAKMNTFNDFIDVTEGLQKAGWARKDATVAAGGSAGGLLMGAVANMRPDLYKVILAYVPFVDVINTMLDETLPLTVGEFEEWGNPKEKAAYDTMMAYSPYDNVKRQAYPTMLVRTSYNDSQVMYWEPAKWVARLREAKTDTNTLLFKIAMEPAGHGGQSGRFDRLKDAAFDYAFVLDQLGMAH
ncbi:MAG: Oligopeptidase [Labilithrix sp.]|nr:Oligopeptidase [Labilithrix sp.]